MSHYLTLSHDSLEKKASYLRLSSKTIADCLNAGNFRSAYIGQGLEFSSLREYLAGDDVRYIDWNVTARFKKPYIKTYKTENEMQFFLIVDTSYSMFVNEKNDIRYKKAAEIASVLTVAAEIANCPIGMVLFDGDTYFSTLPKENKNQTMQILSKLDEPYKNSKKTNGSALDVAIIGAEKILKKRSLIFIISDFRTDNWKRNFLLLSQKHNVYAIMIENAVDKAFPSFGNVRIKDSETNIAFTFPTNNKNFKNSWKQANENRIQNLNDFFIRNGANFSCISTKDDCILPLIKMLQRK